MAKKRKRKPANNVQPVISPKQQAFISEFLVDQNGTQAAIRAGYSAKTANQQAARLLAKVNIRAEVNRRLAGAGATANATAAQVVQELAWLAFSDIGDILDFTGDELRLKRPADIGKAGRRAISSIKVSRHLEGHGDDAETVEVTEFKLWSKTEALDKLCKKLRLYQDPLQAAKTLLSLLPYEMGRRVWAGITGSAATLGPREAPEPGTAGVPANGNPEV